MRYDVKRRPRGFYRNKGEYGGSGRPTDRIRFALSLFLFVSFLCLLGCGKKSANPASSDPGGNSQTESVAVNDRSELETSQDAQPDFFAANGYVGSQSCAECHAEISQQYATHSMGQSAAPVTTTQSMPAIDKAAFEAGGFRYSIEETTASESEASTVWLHCQERVTGAGGMAKVSLPVAHRIGSGKNGQSFLVNRGGHLMMSPMTWYPAKGIWDLSPGYEKNNSQFNRPVIEQCLYCHTDGAHAVEQTINRYQQPALHHHVIGCERCHGPGKQHVAFHENNSQAADDIVNPSKLDPSLREAVCQQCHLSGDARVLKPGKQLHDFRPGKPLSSAYTFFSLVSQQDVDQTQAVVNNGKTFVGHVEQMYQSKCFQASEGQLGCVSCHDPHRLPAPDQRVSFYRDRCMKCHQSESDCSLPKDQRLERSKQDSCIDCHMPERATEIRHAAVSDHSIPRIPKTNVGEAQAPPASPSNPKSVVAFPEAFTAESSDATPRDRAIALTRLATKHSDLLSDNRVFQSVVASLEEATKKNAKDYEAVEALADLYLSERRANEAIQLCKNLLDEEPLRETTLRIVSDTYSNLGQFGLATPYWERMVQVNPWMAMYWYKLGQAYAARQRWQRCLDLAKEGKRRFPTSIGLRHLRIQSLLQSGDAKAAEREYQEVVAFDPEGMDRLTEWYESQSNRK